MSKRKVPFPAQGDQSFPARLKHRGADLLYRLSLLSPIPSRLPPQEPRAGTLNPGETVARHVDRFIELGFHRELGQTEEEYRDTFRPPHPFAQPERYRGKFDILITVDPRVPLDRQLRLARVATDINLRFLRNGWTPGRPYAIWTHDGTLRDPENIKQVFYQVDETPCPLVELLALYLQHPQLVIKGEKFGIDAYGSRYEHNGVIFYVTGAPTMFEDYGRPTVDVIGRERSPDQWGALSRGLNVVILGK